MRTLSRCRYDSAQSLDTHTQTLIRGAKQNAAMAVATGTSLGDTKLQRSLLSSQQRAKKTNLCGRTSTCLVPHVKSFFVFGAYVRLASTVSKSANQSVSSMTFVTCKIILFKIIPLRGIERQVTQNTHPPVCSPPLPIGKLAHCSGSQTKQRSQERHRNGRGQGGSTSDGDHVSNSEEESDGSGH